MRIRVSRKWLFLLAAVVAVRVFAAFPSLVEKYYASGFYPLIARIQRYGFGWLPFSVGDLGYLAFGVYLLWLIFRLVRGKVEGGRVKLASDFISGGAYIYLIFNLFWGLNYNRLDPAKAMGLAVADSATAPELRDLAASLLDRTNRYRPSAMIPYAEARDLAAPLFRSRELPRVTPSSFKPSLFGVLGNYMGYSGYYNPFSGEAQVNTHVPDFLIPFVACHEIAHQAGYAKENEANFVGFLAARRSRDSAVLYSTYLSMFLYANGQLRRLDSASARRNMESLLSGPRKDIETYRSYLKAYDTPVGDLVDAFYDRFLRLNQQPAGSATYSKVILWLVALKKKEGKI